PASYHPMDWPSTPAIQAPAIPKRMVMMNPPGSRPGIRSLAISPTTKPIMIVAIMRALRFVRENLPARPLLVQSEGYCLLNLNKRCQALFPDARRPETGPGTFWYLLQPERVSDYRNRTQAHG